MRQKRQAVRFVVCVRNKGYPASLEVRKVYRVLVDPEGEKHALLRVIDEDGEDYLYPRNYFVPIAVGASAARAIAARPDRRFQRTGRRASRRGRVAAGR